MTVGISQWLLVADSDRPFFWRMPTSNYCLKRPGFVANSLQTNVASMGKGCQSQTESKVPPQAAGSTSYVLIQVLVVS